MDDRARLAELVADPEAFLSSADAAVRRMAVSGTADRVAESGIRQSLERILATDPDEAVRAEAAEVLGGAGRTATEALLAAGSDGSPLVREAVATALGETVAPEAVPWLLDRAEHDGDALVREAAVAALGAIGDERAAPILLRLAADAPPQVRRRVVVALTAFDGAEVEAAVRQALQDRNPMVREAAEMAAGRPLDPTIGCGPIAAVLADLAIPPAALEEET